MAASSVRVDKRKLQAIIKQSPQKVENLLDALAFEGEGYAKRSMGASVSPPGEPPGVVTGALRASIHVERAGQYKRLIATAVDYAIYLEFGTIKMAARPFMAPMAIHLRKAIPTFWLRFIE